MMAEKAKTESKTNGKKAQYGLTISLICGALVVFMCLFIPTGPMKKYNRARAEVMDLRSELNLALQNKAREEERLRAQETLMAQLRERKSNFDLWSFLNTALTETKLKERANLENYRPRSSDKKNAADFVNMAQLTLNGVTLNELVDLLHKISSSGNLIATYSVDYLHPANDSKGLDCKVVFLSPKAIVK